MCKVSYAQQHTNTNKVGMEGCAFEKPPLSNTENSSSSELIRRNASLLEQTVKKIDSPSFSPLAELLRATSTTEFKRYHSTGGTLVLGDVDGSIFRLLVANMLAGKVSVKEGFEEKFTELMKFAVAAEGNGFYTTDAKLSNARAQKCLENLHRDDALIYHSPSQRYPAATKHDLVCTGDILRDRLSCKVRDKEGRVSLATTQGFVEKTASLGVKYVLGNHDNLYFVGNSPQGGTKINDRGVVLSHSQRSIDSHFSNIDDCLNEAGEVDFLKATEMDKAARSCMKPAVLAGGKLITHMGVQYHEQLGLHQGLGIVFSDAGASHDVARDDFRKGVADIFGYQGAEPAIRFASELDVSGPELKFAKKLNFAGELFGGDIFGISPELVSHWAQKQQLTKTQAYVDIVDKISQNFRINVFTDEQASFGIKDEKFSANRILEVESQMFGHHDLSDEGMTSVNRSYAFVLPEAALSSRELHQPPVQDTDGIALRISTKKADSFRELLNICSADESLKEVVISHLNTIRSDSTYRNLDEALGSANANNYKRTQLTRANRIIKEIFCTGKGEPGTRTAAKAGYFLKQLEKGISTEKARSIPAGAENLADRLLEKKYASASSVLKSNAEATGRELKRRIALLKGDEAASVQHNEANSEIDKALNKLLKTGFGEQYEKTLEKLEFLRRYVAKDANIPEYVAPFDNEAYSSQLNQSGLFARLFGNAGVCSAAVLSFFQHVSENGEAGLQEFEQKNAENFVSLQNRFEGRSDPIDFQSLPTDLRPSEFKGGDDLFFEHSDDRSIHIKNSDGSEGAQPGWLEREFLFGSNINFAKRTIGLIQASGFDGPLSSVRDSVLGGVGHAMALYVDNENHRILYFDPHHGMFAANTNSPHEISQLEKLIDRHLSEHSWREVVVSVRDSDAGDVQSEIHLSESSDGDISEQPIVDGDVRQTVVGINEPEIFVYERTNKVKGRHAYL